MRSILAIIPFLLATTADAEINLRFIVGPNAPQKKSYYEAVTKKATDIVKKSSVNGCSGIVFNSEHVSSFDPVFYNGYPVQYQEELNRLKKRAMEKSANIMVLQSLDTCASVQKEKAIAGCAGPAGIVSVEFDGVIVRDSYILAHEIGHRLNLSWGDLPSVERYWTIDKDTKKKVVKHGHLMSKEMLMYPWTSGAGRLSEKECSVFLASAEIFEPHPNGHLGGALLEAGSDYDATDSTDGAPDIIEIADTSLEELLSYEWIHGVPFDELSALMTHKSGLIFLRTAIINPEMSSLWINAITALGYYGDEADITFLNYFLEKSLHDSGVDGRVIADSKISAAFSLGVLTGRFKSVTGAVLASSILDEMIVSLGVETDGPKTEYQTVDLGGVSDDQIKYVERYLLIAALESEQIAFGVLDDSVFAEAVGEDILMRNDSQRESLLALGFSDSVLGEILGISAEIRRDGFNPGSL